jgi:hypothetical protein
MDDAAEADYVLAYTLAVEPGERQPAAHPLACWVPKRSFAYMLAWPFTGQRPIALGQQAVPARRGPVAQAPALPRRNLDAGLIGGRLRRSGTVRISSYFCSL